ncbi:MAG: Stp1/IreP family PP2C-type Ser/Thr phosphatase [Elusimicrobia bacterium]|nr:Stp1/IreP family PP2C-type Ser/Thr phosphatase [Elusimicrobiota bacterium]
MTDLHGMEIAGNTHVGCVRRNNEDSFLIDEDLGLLVVADGMGGHRAGEVASGLAVKSIIGLAHENLGASRKPTGTAQGLSARGLLLRSLVASANARVYEMGHTSPKNQGMGTTIVAVWADTRSMTVAHVGDSRAYLLHEGTLNRLTEDHSVIGEQLRKGLIKPQDAEKSPFASVLTRALGTEADVEIDVSNHVLSPGDMILMATDGLTRMVSDEDVAKVIRDADPPDVFVERLIRMALAAGGTDNVTVVAARVGPQAPQRQAGREPTKGI